jgi:hypothetical protein
MPNVLRLLSLFAILTAILAEGQEYAGPNALGPFRMDKDINMSALFERIGKPSSTSGDLFCYRSKNSNAFLVLTRMTAAYNTKVAGSIMLSLFPNCLKETVTVASTDLATLKTSGGIGLESTVQEVVKRFGKPSQKDTIEGTKYRWVIHNGPSDGSKTSGTKLDIGDSVLIYKGVPDDLRNTMFGIRKGRVVWISMSKNE